MKADRNLAMVDLFDRRHAKKVLALLGQAYGGLPASGSLRKEQDAFLNQAISELAEGDHVISVRLALFAQMFEGKEWKPATLKAIGGATGVGVAFLEESFVAQDRSLEELAVIRQRHSEFSVPCCRNRARRSRERCERNRNF